MATEELPAPARRPGTDQVARALIWAGLTLHELGAHLLKVRHEQMTVELDRARGQLAAYDSIPPEVHREAAARETDEYLNGRQDDEGGGRA